MSATIALLLVDDDPGLLSAERRHLKPLLARLDLLVHTAGGGEEALEFIKSQPDVERWFVRTDLRMGETMGTGADLVRGIRALRPTVNAFVVLVSTVEAEKMVEDPMEIGANAYLNKLSPVYVHELGKHLMDFLEPPLVF